MYDYSELSLTGFWEPFPQVYVYRPVPLLIQIYNNCWKFTLEVLKSNVAAKYFMNYMNLGKSNINPPILNRVTRYK